MRVTFVCFTNLNKKHYEEHWESTKKKQLGELEKVIEYCSNKVHEYAEEILAFRTKFVVELELVCLLSNIHLKIKIKNEIFKFLKVQRLNVGSVNLDIRTN